MSHKPKTLKLLRVVYYSIIFKFHHQLFKKLDQATEDNSHFTYIMPTLDEKLLKCIVPSFMPVVLSLTIIVKLHVREKKNQMLKY